MTTSKEAPDRSEDNSLAIQEHTLKATSLLDEKFAALGERLPDEYFRSPATPRKNVIPPRRASFEAVPQTPHIVKRNTLNGNHAAKSALNDVHLAEPNQHTPRLLDETQMETQILPIEQPIQDQATKSMVEVITTSDTQILPIVTRHTPFPNTLTTPLPTTPLPPPAPRTPRLTHGRALLLALLLIIVVINATTAGFGQAFGSQGWASVFGAGNNTGPSLLNQIGQQLGQMPGVKGKNTTTPPTPQQIVNALLANMTLEQKLGQMMLVRFNGADYGPALNAMIAKYHVGSVIEYAGNIVSKSQLVGMNKQIQQNAELPMIISIDQEGGTVDRLLNLDGGQPSASTIGATGDTNQAYLQGLKDAQDLSNYGFNLNLAPVVDVTNVSNQQLAGRTYGKNPTIVSEMAEAYLKGLQQSGKVLGTIKHFPGLGDTSTDPHTGLPYLTRSLDNLNTIDWMPYKNLFSQKNVYSVMVTHELVKALDMSLPSSLSPKVVSVLRDQLGFQGVIITDGLTMDAIMARYTLGQSAVLAIEAGDDLLMDPGTPNEVAQMIDGIKQAMASGAISQQHIDDSVRRILLFKYQMGLLHIHP
ncbi:MAG: glycoside hydrolase family 3 N-terminal domain-containing protein [Ktedonobacteraceae bacterium]